MAVATATVRRKPARRRRGPCYILRRMRQEWSAYAMLSPGLLLFAVFVVFSICFSVYISFHEWDILNPAKPWVGLDNYSRLKDDPYFRKALYNTFIYTIFSVPCTMVGGLLIALLLNQAIRGRAIFRTVFFLPVITPLVVAALIWKWVYNADFGLANYYLMKFHIISDPVLWLSDPDMAMPSVIVMTVWKGVGFAMVIYLAGLQAIPGDFYEAAALDGATGWNRFRFITWPLLSPTTLFLVVTLTIASFQGFDIVKIMTQGGPITSTMIYVYYIYEQAFQYFRLGKASAAVVVFFGLILLLTLGQWLAFRRRVQYTT